MSVNVIELMDSLIADAQTLSNELAQNEQVQQRTDALLRSAIFIQAELKQYVSADGSLDNVPRESGYYTRTSFAIFETNIYLTKKLGELGRIVLTDSHLKCLERMGANMKSVIGHLDKIWRTE